MRKSLRAREGPLECLPGRFQTVKTLARNQPVSVDQIDLFIATELLLDGLERFRQPIVVGVKEGYHGGAPKVQSLRPIGGLADIGFMAHEMNARVRQERFDDGHGLVRGSVVADKKLPGCARLLQHAFDGLTEVAAVVAAQNNEREKWSGGRN